MLITDAIDPPTFANHESFHLRYGWLKKAHGAVMEDSKVFVSEDATIRLGVGKNMVRAIRFWSIANKILVQSTNPKNPRLASTPIGDAIFDDDAGLDPYLEDPQTLWLLQWLLFAPPCRIPVWWIIINEFAATSISTADLRDSVRRRVTNIPEWKTPSPNSIKKDVDVFLHTYTTEQGNIPIEDYLDCPFRQMRMVMQDGRDTMRFVFGRKGGMTPEITAFACLDFAHRAGIKSKSISVTRLATEPGSVGNVFKIGENELGDMLREACRAADSRLDTINGALHLVFDDAESDAERMLGMAYGRTGFEIPRQREAAVPC